MSSSVSIFVLFFGYPFYSHLWMDILFPPTWPALLICRKGRAKSACFKPFTIQSINIIPIFITNSFLLYFSFQHSKRSRRRFIVSHTICWAPGGWLVYRRPNEISRTKFFTSNERSRESSWYQETSWRSTIRGSTKFSHRGSIQLYLKLIELSSTYMHTCIYMYVYWERKDL